MAKTTMTFDEIRRAKTRAIERVPIILDREWGQKLGEAQARLADLERRVAGRNGDTSLLPEIDELTAEIEALNDERDTKVVEFVFTSIPPGRYERLVAEHPPNKDQRTAAAKEGRHVAYNEKTFPPALVHACLVSPRFTLDEVKELHEPGEEGHEDDEDAPAGARWSDAELGALFLGAQTACLARPTAR